MASFEERKLRLWQGRIETEIAVGGSGPPLIYLHGPWGLTGDRAFIDVLARSHKVYAPKHPGTSSGDHQAAHELDNFWDLVVYHDELFDRLELDAPAVVGHSFGGMVAAEYAATAPRRVGKLVLIDPAGLWRDDLPVKNWMIMPEEARARALFADPTGEAAMRFFDLPEDPKARVAAQVDFVWSQACTGKFAWPLPDKGLKKHIHRIASPTLVVWGMADGVIDPAYAHEFASRIAGARVEMIDRAGHLPHLEQTETVAGLVRGFLGG